jgi:hypothetical protein
MDGITRDSFARYPQMLALRDKVACHPGVVPIYAEIKEGDQLRHAYQPHAA